MVSDDTAEELSKSKYLLSGVIKRVKNAGNSTSEEVVEGLSQLESLLDEVMGLLNNS